MRPLTEEETKIFFKKLYKYIGANTKYLIDRKDEPYCFRVNKDRIYYVSENLVKLAGTFDRKQLISLGTCFGKFTKGGKCMLHISCLDFLAQYAEFKVWVKPSSEMSILYGKPVFKAGLGRITENTPANQGVVIFSMSEIPLAFGVTAKSTQECRKAEPTAIVCHNDCDNGEYLREEDTL